MRLLSALTSCLSLASAVSLAKRAPTPGSLSQVTSFGKAPTAAQFWIYVPKKLAASPGIVLAIHYCTGSAQAYYNGSPYKTLAEQYGFIVIYPSSPHSGTCWDVSSKATLSHEGGGDSNTIANMVKWTITEYKADTTKVFVTGSSSGAMMTVRFHLFSFFLRLVLPTLPLPRSNSILMCATERHGRHIPRTLPGRNRLLWCPCRLLHVSLEWSRCLEQLLRQWSIHGNAAKMGPGRF